MSLADRKVVPHPAMAKASTPAAQVRRRREEMAFLPAALEIVETPPSPTGRWIAGTIIALFCVALIWASVGQIDIVASAQGKLVPSGRSKLIQPLDAGIVKAIHVHDGQTVKAGDVLIELDPTVSKAERDRLQKDLTAARLDVARLRAILAEEGDPISHYEVPEGVSTSQAALQRQLLVEQLAEHKAKLAVLERQYAEKEAELATVEETVAKLDALLPLMEDRLQTRKILYEQQNGTRISYLEALQQLVETQHDRAVQKSRYRQAEAALKALTETRKQAVVEFRKTSTEQLVEAERKAAGLSEELIKAEQRTRQQNLFAPVGGVVQQLAVHTIGGVVTPAQSLAMLVPSDSRVEVEASISNRDIGFVHEGQEVDIKVDTFNFTRYGLLHGKVLSVSRDAIARAKAGEGTGSTSSEPNGQQLVYSAQISIDRSRMEIDDAFVDLAPGMAVTAEIKTGSRSISSYLFSPLLRYAHDSLRER
jgi:hemolysin D